MIRVLFVCLGNICRSPMAEGLFAWYVKEACLAEQFTIDSAGTSDFHAGETAHHKTLAVLTKRQIPYENRSRPLIDRDAEAFDLILAMDTENLRDIKRLFAGIAHPPSMRLFLQDAYDAGLVSLLDVPDPYYTGRYQEVHDLVDPGAQALLARLRREHGL